ncbi:MAG: class I SAM-dependent methyltransferase [Cyclobacteriaceae bacterium]|nr:class I SAM-dependent methyltransferase [Cyclobacteriaceae bacterium]
MLCPLCQHADSLIATQGADKRAYFRCPQCYLIFTKQHLTRAEEEARYRTHQNGPQYDGHINFINRAITPALPYLNSTQRGLDYGCGPIPTLSVILKEKHGIACDDYDPIFYPESPSGKYDFIFSTECFEHFFSPKKEIARIKELLRPQGLLVVMSELWSDKTDLPTWYYFRDKTHVSFYHATTFDYIAGNFGFVQLPCADDRVIILKDNRPR